MAQTFRKIILTIIIVFSGFTAAQAAEPMQRFNYGTGPDQFGQLWLPSSGHGPFPVIILIHGGCWQESIDGLPLMYGIADYLRRQGLAVWNIEYSRVGAPGGGYPGTFRDVANGVDYLRALAKPYHLDLSRVVIIGHSAGASLGLWAAARRRLDRHSPLYGGPPLPVRGVISLGGADDMDFYRRTGPDFCPAGSVEQVVGSAERPGRNPYADTSPAAMLPLHIKQTIVIGMMDTIVPPQFGEAYAAAAKAAGDPVKILRLPNTDHFQLINPQQPDWKQVRDDVLDYLK